MSTPTEVPYTLYKGQNVDQVITVTRDGAALDLTGATVTVTVRNSADGASVTKTSATASELEITDASAGEITIHWLTADTSGLAHGTYTYDVWALLSGGENSPLVAPSRLDLKLGATRPS